MALDKHKYSHEKWYKRNIMLVVSIPLIIGIHWGWWKLQQDPELVDPKDRRNLPYYDMYHIAKRYFTGDKQPIKKTEGKELEE